MAKSAATTSYTAKQIAATRKRGAGKTDWAAVDAKTEAELATDTAGDPAWRGIGEDWHAKARAAAGPLARPKENKRLVSVRYDADVVEFFKGQGRGWQARMNAVLRSFMKSGR